MNQPQPVDRGNNSSPANPNNSKSNLHNRPKSKLRILLYFFSVLLLIILGYFTLKFFNNKSAKLEANLPLQDNNSLIKNIDSTTEGEGGYFCDKKNLLVYLNKNKLYKKDQNLNSDSLIYQQSSSAIEFGSKLQFAVSPNCDQIVLSDGELNTDLILIDLDGKIIKKSRIVSSPNIKYSMATLFDVNSIEGLSWNNNENKITIIYSKDYKSYLGILELNTWNTKRTGDNNYNYDILESNIIQIESSPILSDKGENTLSFDPEDDSQIYLVYNDSQKNIIAMANYKEKSPKLKNIISFGTKTSSINILSFSWKNTKECWIGTSDQIYKIQNIKSSPQVFVANWHSNEKDVNGRKLTRYNSIQIVGNKFLSTRYVQIYDVAFSSPVTIFEKNELFLSNFNEANIQWNKVTTI